MIEADVQYMPDKIVITVNKDKIPKNINKLYVLQDTFAQTVNNNGYYVVSNDFERYSGFLTYFKERDDFEYMTKPEIKLLNMFGVKCDHYVIVAIVNQMSYDYNIQITKLGNTYRMGLVYELEKINIYEDIKITLYPLDLNATYIDMAKFYRKYQLEQGDCKTLKEKISERPELEYIKDSVEIRIRLGWKPAPPPVLEQTEENEPSMHVACDFDRVKDIIDELKKQGVEKCEICLVGWNKSGHDGRWPTAFPVEPLLGGESKLKELIAYAQNNGYKIVCHSNSTDCYSISDYFNNGEIAMVDKNGNICVNPVPWSGGTMYWLCPQIGWEIAQEILPKISELGFRGLHYIDVMSIIEPRTCFHEKHPCNASQTVDYYHKIMELSVNLFGGFASEGVFDYCAKYLDYGLYICFNRKKEVCMDKGIHLWEMVYHGIIMSNSGTNTVNYPIKTPDDRLQVFECGSRPLMYFYSKFKDSGDNWMGINDLTADTDELLKESISYVKKAYDEYKKVSYLQTEFIEDYKELTDDVHEITYSDGTIMVTNFGEDPYWYKGNHVPPKDFICINGSHSHPFV